MIEKKTRIVKTILENKEFSIRKIFNLSGIDYKSAYYLIKTQLGSLQKVKGFGEINIIKRNNYRWLKC